MPRALHQHTYWVPRDNNQCSIKDKSVSGVVLGLNRVNQWKYTSSPLYGLILSNLQYTFNGLKLFISTHIGSQGITYECSIKDKSVSGVDLGLNRVKVWIYTSSPLYGLIVSQIQYTFKCLEPYIGINIGSQGTPYECSIKDKSVIGVILSLNRDNQWKYTSSPLYGLILSNLQYTFNGLELYISTHIGPQGTIYQCLIKDKSGSRVVLGLNTVIHENIHLVSSPL